MVADCVSVMENNSPSLKLIWGPPGTGKTKTTSTILWAMLIKGLRTLTCAPTNTAVLEVASRIVKLVGESSDGSSCFLNDIVLFGSKDRMKIDYSHDLSVVFLDSRVKRLLPCYVPETGWRHCLCSMIDLLENTVSKYNLHIGLVGTAVVVAGFFPARFGQLGLQMGSGGPRWAWAGWDASVCGAS
jgi:senataxin